eukprot:gene1505-891_t
MRILAVQRESSRRVEGELRLSLQLRANPPTSSTLLSASLAGGGAHISATGTLLRATPCWRQPATVPPPGDGGSGSPCSSSSSSRRREKKATVSASATSAAPAGSRRPAEASPRSTSSPASPTEEEGEELTQAERTEAMFRSEPAQQHCASANSVAPPGLPAPRETIHPPPLQTPQRSIIIESANPNTRGESTATAQQTHDEKNGKAEDQTAAAATMPEEEEPAAATHRSGGEQKSSHTIRTMPASGTNPPPPPPSSIGKTASAEESKPPPAATPQPATQPKPKKAEDTIPMGRVVKLVLCHIWPKGEWKMKALVVISVTCVLCAKVLKVMLPFTFKAIIDALSPPTAAAAAASAANGAAAGAFTVAAGTTGSAATVAATAGSGVIGSAVASLGPLSLTACGFVAAYGICRVAGSFAEEFKNVFFAPVGGAGSTNLAMQMVRKMHALDLPFHLNRETGVLSKDLDRGSRAFWNYAYLLLFMVVPTAFEMCLVGTALYMQGGGPFIGIAITAVAAYVAWTLAITNWRAKFRARYNRYDSRVGGRIVDSLLNYETVKYFGSEAYECARIETEVRKMNRQLVILDQTIALLNVGQQLIFAAAAVGSLYMATCGVMAGTMTVGDLVLVDGLLLQLYMPLSYLGMIYREVQSSTQNMQAMIALLDTQCVVKDTPGAKPYEHKDGTIEFRDVGFEYSVALPKSDPGTEEGDGEKNKEKSRNDKDTKIASTSSSKSSLQPAPAGEKAADGEALRRRYTVLSRLNLKIPGGSVVAFVGASGSGKSTIFRLLFRFFNPTSGTVLLDGQPLDSLLIDSVRKKIGVIPQDPILFNESVRYNLCYSRPDATMEELEDVARRARLHETLTGLADGYETSVGERGCKLSGGEKQRVAIARALLDDRPILLADEATSALDTATEAGVMRALRAPTRSGRRRTVLLIAHRLTTVKEADIIFVLSNGSVAEYGSHAELLARGGLYAQLRLHKEERAGGRRCPTPPAEAMDTTRGRKTGGAKTAGEGHTARRVSLIIFNNVLFGEKEEKINEMQAYQKQTNKQTNNLAEPNRTEPQQQPTTTALESIPVRSPTTVSFLCSSHALKNPPCSHTFHVRITAFKDSRIDPRLALYLRLCTPSIYKHLRLNRYFFSSSLDMTHSSLSPSTRPRTAASRMDLLPMLDLSDPPAALLDLVEPVFSTGTTAAGTGSSSSSSFAPPTSVAAEIIAEDTTKEKNSANNNEDVTYRRRRAVGRLLWWRPKPLPAAAGLGFFPLHTEKRSTTSPLEGHGPYYLAPVLPPDVRVKEPSAASCPPCSAALAAAAAMDTTDTNIETVGTTTTTTAIAVAVAAGEEEKAEATEMAAVEAFRRLRIASAEDCAASVVCQLGRPIPVGAHSARRDQGIPLPYLGTPPADAVPVKDLVIVYQDLILESVINNEEEEGEESLGRPGVVRLRRPALLEALRQRWNVPPAMEAAADAACIEAFQMAQAAAATRASSDDDDDEREDSPWMDPWAGINATSGTALLAGWGEKLLASQGEQRNRLYHEESDGDQEAHAQLHVECSMRDLLEAYGIYGLNLYLGVEVEKEGEDMNRAAAAPFAVLVVSRHHHWHRHALGIPAASTTRTPRGHLPPSSHPDLSSPPAALLAHLLKLTLQMWRSSTFWNAAAAPATRCGRPGLSPSPPCSFSPHPTSSSSTSSSSARLLARRHRGEVLRAWLDVEEIDCDDDVEQLAVTAVGTAAEPKLETSTRKKAEEEDAEGKALATPWALREWREAFESVLFVSPPPPAPPSATAATVAASPQHSDAGRASYHQHDEPAADPTTSTTTATNTSSAAAPASTHPEEKPALAEGVSPQGGGNSTTTTTTQTSQGGGGGGGHGGGEDEENAAPSLPPAAFTPVSSQTARRVGGKRVGTRSRPAGAGSLSSSSSSSSSFPLIPGLFLSGVSVLYLTARGPQRRTTPALLQGGRPTRATATTAQEEKEKEEEKVQGGGVEQPPDDGPPAPAPPLLLLHWRHPLYGDASVGMASWILAAQRLDAAGRQVADPPSSPGPLPASPALLDSSSVASQHQDGDDDEKAGGEGGEGEGGGGSAAPSRAVRKTSRDSSTAQEEAEEEEAEQGTRTRPTRRHKPDPAAPPPPPLRNEHRFVWEHLLPSSSPAPQRPAPTAKRSRSGDHPPSSASDSGDEEAEWDPLWGRVCVAARQPGRVVVPVFAQRRGTRRGGRGAAVAVEKEERWPLCGFPFHSPSLLPPSRLGLADTGGMTDAGQQMEQTKRPAKKEEDAQEGGATNTCSSRLPTHPPPSSPVAAVEPPYSLPGCFSVSVHLAKDAVSPLWSSALRALATAAWCDPRLPPPPPPPLSLSGPPPEGVSLLLVYLPYPTSFLMRAAGSRSQTEWNLSSSTALYARLRWLFALWSAPPAHVECVEAPAKPTARSDELRERGGDAQSDPAGSGLVLQVRVVPKVPSTRRLVLLVMEGVDPAEVSQSLLSWVEQTCYQHSLLLPVMIMGAAAAAHPPGRDYTDTSTASSHRRDAMTRCAANAAGDSMPEAMDEGRYRSTKKTPKTPRCSDRTASASEASSPHETMTVLRECLDRFFEVHHVSRVDSFALVVPPDATQETAAGSGDGSTRHIATRRGAAAETIRPARTGKTPPPPSPRRRSGSSSSTTTRYAAVHGLLTELLSRSGAQNKHQRGEESGDSRTAGGAQKKSSSTSGAGGGGGGGAHRVFSSVVTCGAAITAFNASTTQRRNIRVPLPNMNQEGKEKKQAAEAKQQGRTDSRTASTRKNYSTMETNPEAAPSPSSTPAPAAKRRTRGSRGTGTTATATATAQQKPKEKEKHLVYAIQAAIVQSFSLHACHFATHLGAKADCSEHVTRRQAYLLAHMAAWIPLAARLLLPSSSDAATAAAAGPPPSPAVKSQQQAPERGRTRPPSSPSSGCVVAARQRREPETNVRLPDPPLALRPAIAMEAWRCRLLPAPSSPGCRSAAQLKAAARGGGTGAHHGAVITLGLVLPATQQRCAHVPSYAPREVRWHRQHAPLLRLPATLLWPALRYYGAFFFGQHTLHTAADITAHAMARAGLAELEEQCREAMAARPPPPPPPPATRTPSRLRRDNSGMKLVGEVPPYFTHYNCSADGYLQFRISCVVRSCVLVTLVVDLLPLVQWQRRRRRYQQHMQQTTQGHTLEECGHRARGGSRKAGGPEEDGHGPAPEIRPETGRPTTTTTTTTAAVSSRTCMHSQHAEKKKKKGEDAPPWAAVSQQNEEKSLMALWEEEEQHRKKEKEEEQHRKKEKEEQTSSSGVVGCEEANENKSLVALWEEEEQHRKKEKEGQTSSSGVVGCEEANENKSLVALWEEEEQHRKKEKEGQTSSSGVVGCEEANENKSLVALWEEEEQHRKKEKEGQTSSSGVVGCEEANENKSLVALWEEERGCGPRSGAPVNLPPGSTPSSTSLHAAAPPPPPPRATLGDRSVTSAWCAARRQLLGDELLPDLQRRMPPTTSLSSSLSLYWEALQDPQLCFAKWTPDAVFRLRSCSCTPRPHERVPKGPDGNKACRHMAEVWLAFLYRQWGELKLMDGGDGEALISLLFEGWKMIYIYIFICISSVSLLSAASSPISNNNNNKNNNKTTPTNPHIFGKPNQQRNKRNKQPSINTATCVSSPTQKKTKQNNNNNKLFHLWEPEH